MRKPQVNQIYGDFVVKSLAGIPDENGKKLNSCFCRHCGREKKFSDFELIRYAVNDFICQCKIFYQAPEYQQKRYGAPDILLEDIVYIQGKQRKVRTIKPGTRCGFLVVLDDIRKSENGMEQLCECDCGNQTYVPTSSLLYGASKSCGCQKKWFHKQRDSWKENIEDRIAEIRAKRFKRENQRQTSLTQIVRLPTPVFIPIDRATTPKLEYPGFFGWVKRIFSGNIFSRQ